MIYSMGRSMELMYQFTSIIMSLWTFTRKPEAPDECTTSFLRELEWCETRKHGRPGPNRLVFQFSRWSKSKAKAQLSLCREVQQRMDFNDKAKVAYTHEGIHMSRQRHRDLERKEIERVERQNGKNLRNLDRESDDDENGWQQAKKQYVKELYADQRKSSRRAKSGSPDPSDVESDEHGSVYSSPEEELPPPRRNRSRERRRAPQPSTARTPEMQEEIQGAIEFLRGFGIETITPNGGKCLRTCAVEIKLTPCSSEGSPQTSERSHRTLWLGVRRVRFRVRG
jgi:hypothetical protein